jgi:hypothetical protein
MDKESYRITDLDCLLQIVCDPENQPHQFMGDENGLKEMFFKDANDCSFE